MIIKVVQGLSRTIANYKVVYESGNVRHYTHNNVPKSVIKFCNTHRPVTNRIRNDWVVNTYIYNNEV